MDARSKHLDKHTIKWSKVESSIVDLESDVLLIFDCCFAGRLSQAQRTLSNNYELLGACSQDQTTCSAGDKSFTTALIKSLEHLAERNGPFNTAQLRSTILDKKVNKDLPAGQMPVLSDRFHRGKHVVITRQSLVEQSGAGQDRTSSESRSPHLREYMVLRLHYPSSITEDLVRDEADILKGMMDGVHGHRLAAKHITYQHKSSLVRDRWRAAAGQLWRSRASPAITPTTGLLHGDSSPLVEQQGLSAISDGDLSSRPRSPIFSMTAADETQSLLRSDGYEKQPRTHETSLAYHLAMVLRLLRWRLLRLLSFLRVGSSQPFRARPV